jgi:hypothetical protein
LKFWRDCSSFQLAAPGVRWLERRNAVLVAGDAARVTGAFGEEDGLDFFF